MKYWLSIFVLLFAIQAQATTINEAELDAIFAQDSFGQNLIDIRLLPTQSLARPNLLNIRQDISGNPFSDPQNVIETGNLADLFALGGSEPVVNLFWVDSIRVFGLFALGIAEGLGTGNSVAVIKSIQNVQSEVIAHEIGHLLGLEHEGAAAPPFFQPNFNIDNLMSVSPNHKTTLNTAQVSTIIGSDLVQGNQASGFFIKVQPFLIVEETQVATVPLPASGVLLIFSLFSVRLFGRRRFA